MADRILAAPDVYASCPYDGKVLSHYVGVFSAVYIAFSPFIQPDPGFHERYLSDLDVIWKEVLAYCRAVSWKEIAQQCGLPDVAAVDIALPTRPVVTSSSTGMPGIAPAVPSKTLMT